MLSGRTPWHKQRTAAGGGIRLREEIAILVVMALSRTGKVTDHGEFRKLPQSDREGVPGRSNRDRHQSVARQYAIVAHISTVLALPVQDQATHARDDLADPMVFDKRWDLGALSLRLPNDDDSACYFPDGSYRDFVRKHLLWRRNEIPPR